jgi:LPS sulfotransferase NodH
MEQNIYFDLIILATQRSGSTMVCDDIRNVGNLGLPEEYFIPAKNINKERKSCLKFLKRIIEKSRVPQTEITSVKIMADQLEAVDQVYTGAEIYSEGIDNQYLFLKKARAVIYCYRSNLVKQAISRLMARKTGYCHSVRDTSKETFAGNASLLEEEYNAKVQISPKEVIEEAKKIEKENQLILEVIEQKNIKPLISSYEDYIEKPKCVLDLALKIYGTEIHQKDIYRKRTLKKMPESKSLEIYNQTIAQYKDDEISHLIRWSPDNIDREEKYLGKTFVILGGARGGTSAVSGILRTWGVYMGDCLGDNHEDQEMLKTRKELPQVIETIKNRNVDYKDWGWKAPNSIFWLEDVMPYLRNPYFIVVVRHPLSMAQSQVKRSGADLQTGFCVSIGYYQHITTFIKNVKPEKILLISYEDLISSKDKILQEISDFIEIKLNPEKMKSAKAFLVPGNYRKIKT